jgi:hypothetical protein
MNTTLLRPELSAATPALAPGGTRISATRPKVTGSLAWLSERLSHLWTRREPPLVLEFPDCFVHFRSVQELDFALSSRTDFPAVRIRELIALSPRELELTARAIRRVERRFANILARSVREPGLIGEFMRELDLKTISQDHGWRDIMESLVRLSPDLDAYKRVALVKYMQYLRARQHIMRSVFVEKTRGDGSAGLHAAREPRSAPAVSLSDTASLDLTSLQHGEGLDEEFVTLPKGESVRIDLGNARDMELVLAGNRMRLYTGREWYLSDDGGNTYPLRPGKNLVGRHSGCHVVVDSACRSVSRTHLILEPAGEAVVILTDLSSHGTEVPGHLLRQH